MRSKHLNSRNVAWAICLIISAVACIIWSQIPSIESLPRLRIALFAIQGFSMLGLVFFFPKTNHRTALKLILLSAVLLRVLLWPAPVSDDVNRYLWEGKIVASGENPYSAPADDARWENRRDAIWEGMNHHDRPTAYPPGVQWLMGATTMISPSLKSFKILALVGDLTALLILFALLRQQIAPIRWAGFYAFNPIILNAFAAEAHFDSLMIAAMLGAVLAAQYRKKSAWLWLGIAIQIKLICLVLVPLFLTKKSLRSSWILPLILILPGLPFLSALPNWLTGIREFAGSGAFNAPLFSLLASQEMHLEIVRSICFIAFGLFAATICIARWRGLALIDSALWMLGALLVCSPIVHFWYLAWLLPLAALRPSFAWITLSITMAVYFIAWETQAHFGWWGFEYQIAAIIWLPWLMAAIAQHRFLPTRLLAKPLTPQPSPRFSIVIPVLKAGPELQPLITSLRKDTTDETEIIVVEVASQGASSSQDNIAGTRLITAPRGRGNQIAAGISVSSAPWILVVHSDCLPNANFTEPFQQAVAIHPNASLIIFGQRFDKTGIGSLMIETLNELRVVFGGVAFGDQTMVLRRSALEQSGGFPAQPLMEDVEASMRLASQGDVIYLGEEWTVSAKKWSSNFLSRFFLVIRLVASYQLARLRGKARAAAVSEKMYSQYYPSRDQEKT